MGIFDRIFGKKQPERLDIDELASRLRMPVARLREVEVAYRPFTIPKRSGGTRTIHAPAEPLKQVQRAIARQLLQKLKSDPHVTGFERGYSIVSNAVPHVGRRVVIRLDVENFFSSTSADRVGQFFRSIGWNDEAATLLTRLTTHNGALPQGAPTSPRLSNLVNNQMDLRLAAMASKFEANYSRYADDITFSSDHEDGPQRVNVIIHVTKRVLSDFGYRLHTQKKLRIARRHNRQIVTGLVVNSRPALPRETRRWLRAVEHRQRTGLPITISPEQLAGWRSLQQMIAQQTT